MKKEEVWKTVLGLTAIVFLLHALFLLDFFNPIATSIGFIFGFAPEENPFEQILLSTETVVSAFLVLVAAAIIYSLWRIIRTITKEPGKNNLWTILGKAVSKESARPSEFEKTMGNIVDSLGSYAERTVIYIVTMLLFEFAIVPSFDPNASTTFALASFNHGVYLLGFLITSDLAFSWSAPIGKIFRHHSQI